MEKEIINYVQINQKEMGKNDFDTFIESDEFMDMSEPSRIKIFYMNAFIMS